MNHTTTWHHGFARRTCALLAKSFLAAGLLAFGLPTTDAMTVDDSASNIPSIYSSSVATMPTISGSSLTAAGVTQSNLASFSIVLNPSPALSANPAALAAFTRAAQNWQSRISDPITITIDADFSVLGAGILGSTGSVILQAPYNTIRSQMVIDASDEPDDAIVASLPTAAQFSATVPAGFSLNGNLEATKANLKALGFNGLDQQFGVSDASIAFSSTFPFDFDKSNGITAGQYDFEGIATHEIGHALGFISSVDDVDFILPGTSTQIQPTPLDLFRFRDGSANDPTTAAQFTTFARDMVPGQPDMFDQINNSFGGATEVLFSTGEANGDGRQASHWKDDLGLGIMDPTVAPGELLSITQNDLRAFDLIGYEINAVPEPATCPLLALGLITFGASRRR